MKKLLLTTIAATLLLLTANLAFAETPKGFDKTVILSSMTATHFQVGNAKYYATMQSTAPYMVISSTGITITGVIDGRDISADGATLDALAGLGGSGVGYFTVSPSTGIDSGMLAAGVKIGTANVQATGEPSATTYWRGDGAWAEVAQSTATYWQTSTIDTAADFGGGTCVNIDTVTTGGSIAMVPQIEQTAYETITGNLTSRYRYRQPIIPEHTTTINGLALKTNRDTATQTLKVSICDSAMDVLVSSVAPIVPNINIDYPSTTLAAYTTYYIVIETVTIDTYWNFRHTSSEPYSPSNLQYADYAGGEWSDAGVGHDIYFVLQSTAGLYTTPVVDGSSLWSDWGLFTTNDSAPEGSAIAYYVKTSTYADGLASAMPVAITSGSAIASLVGPYAQLIVDLSRSDSAVDPAVNRLDTLYCADGSVKLTGANMTGPLSATTLTGTHYGDGSNLTGLPGGGDMVASVHGVAIAAATTTLSGMIPTAHQQLTSTGTLTHAALESTLTAVTAATTTLKSVSDAQAATLVQVGVDTATLRVDVTALQGAQSSVGASTATLRTDMTAAQNSLTAVGASTATLRTDITTLSASTATLRTNITAIGVSTNTLAGQITAIRASTSTLRTDITTLQTATGTLKAQIAAVAVSTGAFTAVGASTSTLRTDVNALKASTGAVCYASHYIVWGNTQAFVTNLSTQPVSSLQSAPLGAFTISSATARIVEGTSATIRLFITAKNSEYNIATATPIWSAAVTAGTAHTGGTLLNVSVGVDNAITAVIDAIVDGVKYIDIAVRGTR